ncbi:MAG: hypothetical protein RIT81_06280 [Deltaproteobacteria bacterium]
MADELTTQILIEIRDATRATNERLDHAVERLDGRLDETNQRLDQTNERLGILAKLTQSIDGRLAKIEEREPDRLFLPRRVDRLEADRDDHEARLAALERG